MKKYLHLGNVRPSQIVLFSDQFLIAFGLITALFAQYRILSYNLFPLKTILIRVAIHVSIGIIAWIVFKMYKRVIRYFHSNDYLNIILVVFLIHSISFLFRFILPEKLLLSPEIFLISFFVTTMYIVFSRLIISYMFSLLKTTKRQLNQKALMIYGAGELGFILKNSIASYYEENFKLIGFLDDDKTKIGRMIQGTEVFNANTGKLVDLLKKKGITDIIIASKSLTPTRKAKFLQDIINLNIRIKEIASVDDLLNSNFTLDKLSTIDINDLMNRDPIELYDAHVADDLEGKKVMVTGAAGSIGSEIVRKLAEHNAGLIICVDFSESALYDVQQEMLQKHKNVQFQFVLADIRDEEKIARIFEKNHPDAVFHAAAYKHVPLMEEFPWEAVQTNVVGTWKLAKLSLNYKVQKFILISSDKAVNPTSIMGATKRLAEIIVQSYSSKLSATRFITTRFGNVLGSNGSVVPLFKKQIFNGGPVCVTHPEMTRYFMTIPEACQLVLEASVMAGGGEVFVFDMGKPVKILDLANNMIRLAGYIPGIDMQVKFVGLRPGEKLYEDLFSKDADMKETHHEKIMISKENLHDISESEKIIEKLQDLEGFYNPELFQKVIKELLPEYKSEEFKTSKSLEVEKKAALVESEIQNSPKLN